jgi:hypothetical protein
METVRTKEFKDRFIKGSISDLPEHFNTKWEINDTSNQEEYTSSPEI